MENPNLQSENGRSGDFSLPEVEALEFEKEEFQKYKTGTWELFLGAMGERDASEVLASLDWDFITDCMVYDHLSFRVDDSESDRAETMGARAYMENELKWSQGKILRFCAEVYISEMEIWFESLVRDLIRERHSSDLQWRRFLKG